MLQTSPGATAAEGATTAALRAGGSSAGSVIPKPFGETVRVRIRRLPEDRAANPPSPFGPEKSAARAAAAAAALVAAPKSWVTAPILPRSVSVTTHSSPELAPGSASASTAIPGSEALTRPVVPVVDGPAVGDQPAAVAPLEPVEVPDLRVGRERVAVLVGFRDRIVEAVGVDLGHVLLGEPDQRRRQEMRRRLVPAEPARQPRGELLDGALELAVVVVGAGVVTARHHIHVDAVDTPDVTLQHVVDLGPSQQLLDGNGAGGLGERGRHGGLLHVVAGRG